MSQKWFVQTRSGKAGPFTLVQMKSMVKTGRLKPNMKISPDGKDWMVARHLAALGFDGPAPADAAEAQATDAADSEAEDRPARAKVLERIFSVFDYVRAIIDYIVYDMNKGWITGGFLGAGLVFIPWAFVAIGIQPFLLGSGLGATDNPVKQLGDQISNLAGHPGWFIALPIAIVVGALIGMAAEAADD